MTGPLGIGVIGTGGMGGRHVDNLTDEVASAQVTAVMDIDQKRLQEVAQRCSASHAFGDAHELVHHPDVEAVVIASPDRFHAELTQACIEAGKPVLCEKPMATSAAEALKVIEAEVAHGTRLVQLGFMREFDPAHQKVKRISAGGELGKLLAFQGVHINPVSNKPRTVADVITNSAIHDIHSARWMMAEEIDTVFASVVAADPSRPETARLVLLQIVFANGAVGHVECNARANYGYEVDVKITGEQGTVQTNSLQSAIVSIDGNRGNWVEDDWLQRFDEAYVREDRAWVRSIQAGRPAGPSAWDGYVSMIVADACVESAKTGKPVRVDTPDKPAIYHG